MKKSHIFLSLSSIITVPMVVAPMCSCVAQTKVQAKNAETNTKIDAEYVKNYQAPKDSFAIEKVKKSGKQIYQNCWMLDNENAGKGHKVTAIPANKFQGNKTLEHVSYSSNSAVDESLTTITKGSFQACSNLSSVAIPTTVTAVQERAFFRCSNLKTISFEDFSPANWTTQEQRIANCKVMSAKLASIDFKTDAFKGVAESGTLVLDDDFFNFDDEGKFVSYVSDDVEEDLTNFGKHLIISGLPATWLDTAHIEIITNGTDSKGFWKWNKITQELNKIESGKSNLTTAAKAWGFTDETALIGATGKATINGVAHSIRIIDTNRNTTVDSNGNIDGTAALTFEFVNLLSDSSGAVMTTKWDESKNADYTNSTIRANLNGSGKGTKSWSNTALDMIKTAGITPVKVRNQVNTGSTSDGWTATNCDDEIFLNSAIGLMGETAMGKWNGGSHWTSYGTKYQAEETNGQYKFYADNLPTTEDPLEWDSALTDEQKKIVLKYSVAESQKEEPTAYLYWLRSPSVLGTDSAWCVTSTGVVGYRGVSSSDAVAPCFCLGKTTSFDQVGWDFISQSANQIEEGTTFENSNFAKMKILKDGTYQTPTSLTDFVGQERTVMVNDQPHTVRVVGTSGEDSSIYQVNKIAGTEKSAALTFEFANLISDSNGKSLACQYKDTTDTSSSSNQNYYANSTLRMNLVGTTVTASAASITWFEREATSYSTTYTKSVWDMLPSVLTTNGVIKATSRTYTGKGGECTCSDKLFLPAGKELGYNTSGSQLPYYYYKDCTSQTDATRIKTQVVRDSNATSKSSCASKVKTSGVYNYAGYDNESSGYGGICWLASPLTNYSYGVWFCNVDGYLYGSRVYNGAFGVAPCFCI